MAAGALTTCGWRNGNGYITPHLVVRDVLRAAQWYIEALGATEQKRVPLPRGKVMTTELAFGDSTVMTADEFPDHGIVSPLTLGGTCGALQITTTNADALSQQAIDAGAQVFQPLSDAFWGERHGQIIDPFGHRWRISQHLRDVSAEEIAREAAKAFGSRQPSHLLEGPTCVTDCWARPACGYPNCSLAR